MESDLNLRLVRTDTARHIDIKTQAQAILERYIALVRFARAAIELYGTIICY